VKYNNSDGMSNEIITNTNSTTLTDLEPNTTYTLVVEALTPDNNTVTTSQPETFTTSKKVAFVYAWSLFLNLLSLYYQDLDTISLSFWEKFCFSVLKVKWIPIECFC